MGMGVFVGTIAAGIGVFGGTGVNDAAIVGVETIVGVGACVGELVGESATTGTDLTGSGVGGQDGSHPRRQRKSGSGVDVSVSACGGADDNSGTDCKYQPNIAPPAIEMVIAPPTIARNDPQSSLNIELRLCGVFIQGGGLRNPCAAN